LFVHIPVEQYSPQSLSPNHRAWIESPSNPDDDSKKNRKNWLSNGMHK
jgi:hypothetical protein